MEIKALESGRLAPIEHRYTTKDSILCALDLGFGVRGAGTSGLLGWAPMLKIDWIKILHGEQSFEIHRALSAEGVVRGALASSSSHRRCCGGNQDLDIVATQ